MSCHPHCRVIPLSIELIRIKKVYNVIEWIETKFLTSRSRTALAHDFVHENFSPISVVSRDGICIGLLLELTEDNFFKTAVWTYLSLVDILIHLERCLWKEILAVCEKN